MDLTIPNITPEQLASIQAQVGGITPIPPGPQPIPKTIEGRSVRKFSASVDPQVTELGTLDDSNVAVITVTQPQSGPLQGRWPSIISAYNAYNGQYKAAQVTNFTDPIVWGNAITINYKPGFYVLIKSAKGPQIETRIKSYIVN